MTENVTFIKKLKIKSKLKVYLTYDVLSYEVISDIASLPTAAPAPAPQQQEEEGGGGGGGGDYAVDYNGEPGCGAVNTTSRIGESYLVTVTAALSNTACSGRERGGGPLLPLDGGTQLQLAVVLRRHSPQHGLGPHRGTLHARVRVSSDIISYPTQQCSAR